MIWEWIANLLNPQIGNSKHKQKESIHHRLEKETTTHGKEESQRALESKAAYDNAIPGMEYNQQNQNQTDAQRTFMRKQKEKDPLRIFTKQMKAMCWQNAKIHPQLSPERWRLDPLDNLLFKPYRNCNGPFCYQHDHIVPHAKGGQTEIQNCQVSCAIARQLGTGLIFCQGLTVNIKCAKRSRGLAGNYRP